MAENARLTDVKNALGITGEDQDSTLLVYIAEVEAFLSGAGVPSASVTSGLVARGVADLWQYGSGEGALSPYFLQRAAQLALSK